MDGVLRARIAASIMAVAGAALLWWHPAGVILVTAGIALLLVAQQEPSAPEMHLARLVKELDLRGPGHHLPTPEGVRLFIPADADGPFIMPEIVGAVHRDPPGSIGLALDPPAAPLLQRWQAREGLPEGQGAEEILHHLSRAMPRLGLARNVRVGHKGSTIHIRMRLRDPEPARQAQDSGWHMQGGCAAQSFACAIAALALDAPIRIRSSVIDDDGTLSLEVVPGSTV